LNQNIQESAAAAYCYHGQSVAHLAWKKGVSCRRAAFDINFQHKTTLSLKTRNWWILQCCQTITLAKFCWLQCIGNISS